MKWLFILLLLLNLIYFGWELDRQAKVAFRNSVPPLVIPADVKKLALLRELTTLPPSKHSRDESDENEVVEENITTGQEDLLSESDQSAAGNQENTQTESEQPVADVMIKEEFAQDLVTSLPDISIPGIPDATQSAMELCFSYGPFPDDHQTKDLMVWFEARQISVHQRLETEKEHQLFWIYLAPQVSRDSAIEAIEELKNKGIKDYRLIETGNLQNAISLGLFSTQASVNKRLNELKNKGYQPIVVPYRDAKAIYWVDVKLINQQNLLTDMFSDFPARFNSVPVKCDEIALLQVSP